MIVVDNKKLLLFTDKPPVDPDNDDGESAKPRTSAIEPESAICFATRSKLIITPAAPADDPANNTNFACKN
ncbi:hypothetical protein DERP_009790 [Dermatophagoides pteronyssinus]|uniref:Uncharacterized protein n=1 Tax=Dermatophagoides pteronyssinus TaxID=6956 RepID=A0ABQ8IR57_DERPT|nr:hypothetical protein DERP_009790 [Dermatophagoides pteronyssinus]